MTAIPTSSNHRSGVVRPAPFGVVELRVGHGLGQEPDDLTGRARSASGIDQAPAAASARTPAGFGARSAAAPRSSGDVVQSNQPSPHGVDQQGARPELTEWSAAVSTRALGRHEKRSGDRSMIRSSVTCVRRMDSQRDVPWGQRCRNQDVDAAASGRLHEAMQLCGRRTREPGPRPRIQERRHAPLVLGRERWPEKDDPGQQKPPRATDRPANLVDGDSQLDQLGSPHHAELLLSSSANGVGQVHHPQRGQRDRSRRHGERRLWTTHRERPTLWTERTLLRLRHLDVARHVAR